jgi:hypothetical protein
MPSPTPPHHALSWQLEECHAELDNLGITTRGEHSTLTTQETDILSQDSSHVILAATSNLGQAFELPHAGGLFTNSLIDSLIASGTDNVLKHKTMTYNILIEETNKRMMERWHGFRDQVLSDGRHVVPPRTLDRLCQKAECTDNYKEQLLFNGLLSRRVTEENIKPFITVNYSDL